MKQNITILGTGSWGIALAQVLIDNGHDVMMFGKDPLQIEEINQRHQNTKYFDPSIFFPKTLKATLSLEDAIVDAALILIAVPSQAVTEVLKAIKPLLKKKVLFVNAAKGYDPVLKKRFSEVIREIIPKKFLTGVVTLVGPSHAEEVILRQLTLVAAASKQVPMAKLVADLFANPYFRVYVQRDEIGAEVGGALKNVIAIASGVITGLKLGDNARAALVTRGLTELMRLGQALGGKLKTLTGLTGLGDLIVTCYSQHSRNYQAGIQIGKDNASKAFLKNNKKTIEGIPFSKIAYELMLKHKLSLPLIEAVYFVLYEDKKPTEMVKSLMSRPLKVE
jgi:glycerol-3-phosphate dehydrogenase (NAD(P)+)